MVRVAIELRRTAAGRHPLLDSLIAGRAFSQNMFLVHRDAYMEQIQNADWRDISLPKKEAEK